MVERPTGRLILASLVVGLLLILPASYQVAIINQPEATLKAFVNQSAQIHYGVELTSISLSSLWGFIVSSSGLACILAALVIPPLTRRFGRRKIVFWFGAFSIVSGSLLEFLSYYVKSFELFTLGQMMAAGFGWAFSYSLGVVYLVECSPPQWRGLAGGFLTVASNLGNLIAYSVGVPTVLGSGDKWPFYALITVFPPILALVLMPLVRENPKHLYIYRGEEEKARKSISHYYGSGYDHKVAFQGYEEEKLYAERRTSLLSLWRSPALRRGLLISMAAGVFNQVSGSAVIFSYSASIFKEFSFSDEKSNRFTVIMVAPLPFLGVLASLVVDKLGRRPLLLVSGALMVLCLLLLPISGLLADHTDVSSMVIEYMVVGAVFLNVWISALGTSPISSMVVAEILPQSAVTVATSCVLFINNVTYVFCSFAFPPLQATINYWAILVVLVIPSIICWIFLFFKLPETKNLSTHEVMRSFHTRSFKETDPLLDGCDNIS